jgi:hypothetical protein
MATTVTYTVATEAEFDAAIAAIDLGGTASAINTDYVILITADLGLASDIPAIALATGDTLTIQGANADNPNSLAVIDGGGGRGFVVNSGTVSLANLSLIAMSAPGGTGGVAGGGGALFVGAGAVVSTSSVNFSSDVRGGAPPAVPCSWRRRSLGGRSTAPEPLPAPQLFIRRPAHRERRERTAS